MIQVIPTSSNSQIKLTTEEIKAKLVEKYKDSDISKNMRKRVQELALSVCNPKSLKKIK